ncbi:hypothetical protein Btru_076122 [Bulinus truncatus]|nr:hypothetical protein Btru_076122 [Bulinus truncatus]
MGGGVFDWSTGVFGTGFTQNRVYNLDSWHLAEVDIGYVAESFYIVIMARKSYLSRGTIAIDDVSLVNCGPPEVSPVACTLPSYFKCASGYCVDPTVVCDLAQDCGDGSDETGCREITACSFENSLCDWQQESTSTTWKIGTGSIRDTPISRDHTLGTSSGHYLYLNSFPSQINRVGSIARLVSPSFQSTTTSNKTCQLTLYYYMKNNLNNSVSLSVSLRTAIGGYERQMFSRQRGDYSAWERNVIHIVSNVNFQILIEASSDVSATVNQAVVAIDDTVFSSGCIVVPLFLPTPDYIVTTQPVTTSSCSSGQHQCPDGRCILQTFVCDMKTDCDDGSDETDCGPCEFETGTCGWYSISTGSLDWGVSNSGLMGVVGPSVDTTYKNASGHYLYIKPAYGLDNSQAELTSGPLPAIISNCSLTLQYYVNPTISGHLSISTYYQGLSVPLMTIKVDPLSTSGWQERIFSFIKNVEEGSQLVLMFQADNINGSQNIAAVDSIRFHGCFKQDEVINLDCSFDYKDLCQWKQSSQDVFDWTFSGSDVFTPNGPKRDHSSIGSGYYLLARSQNRHMRDTTVLVSPVLSPSAYDGHCLSFWYYMNGDDVGSLKVEMYTVKTNIILYERIGSLQNRWSQALVPVRTLDSYSLGIKAEVTGGYNGDIGIDDIQFEDGACSSPNECMYEDNNFCDWYEKVGDTIRWSLGSKATITGSVPSTDHTLNTQNGHFAYVQSSSSGSATLRSTLRLSAISNATLCLQFWYHMVGERAMQLNTYATLQDGQTRTFLSLHGPSEDLWRKASVPITSVTGAYELQMSAVVQEGVGHVAIDDLVLQQDRCPSQGGCSFNDDMCSFTAMSRGGAYEWVLHSDSPAGAFSNSFVLAQTTNETNAGDSCVLLSEVITAVSTSHFRCLQFSVQLTSASTVPTGVSLNIFTRNSQGSDKILIGALDTFSYNKWSVYQATIEARDDFEFFFEAVCVSRSNAGIALDDVTLNVGPCSGQGTTISIRQSTTPLIGSSLPGTVVTATPTTNKVCPGHYQCQQATTRCVVLCDGLKDCVDGTDESNCDISTQTLTSALTIAAGPDGHVTSSKSHGDNDDDDTWKLPVGIVLGLLLAAIVVVAIVLFIRHRRRIPFQELESDAANQTLNNPAYMYGASNQAMSDDPEGCEDCRATTGYPVMEEGCEDSRATTSYPVMEEGCEDSRATAGYPVMEEGCEDCRATTGYPVMEEGCEDCRATTGYPVMEEGCEDCRATTGYPVMEEGCEDCRATTGYPVMEEGCEDCRATTGYPVMEEGCEYCRATTGYPVMEEGCEDCRATTGYPVMEEGCEDSRATTGYPVMEEGCEDCRPTTGYPVMEERCEDGRATTGYPVMEEGCEDCRATTGYPVMEEGCEDCRATTGYPVMEEGCEDCRATTGYPFMEKGCEDCRATTSYQVMEGGFAEFYKAN